MAEDQQPIRKGDRVVARRDLDGGVKTGDRGTVMLANGFEWLRYWVDFGEGRQLHWLDADDIEPAKKGLFRH